MQPKETHRDRIAREIAEQMERGTAPWVRPWATKAAGRPHNPITKTRYKGFNFLHLHCAHAGYAFATYKQIAEKGGKVKPGAKAVPILFWSPVPGGVKAPEAPEGEEGEGGRRSPFVLKTYMVFSLEEDTEGMEAFIEPPPPVRPQVERHGNAEALIEAWRRVLAGGIEHGGGSAYYRRDQDLIRLPEQGHFHDDPAYYATAFHEISHATGHERRLNRKFGAKYADPRYAFEELVAELSAAFLCAEIGIDGQLQHAAYLASWAKLLHTDGSAFLRACGLAQKAADRALVELHAYDTIAAAE